MLSWFKAKLRKWLEVPANVTAVAATAAPVPVVEQRLPEGADLFSPEDRLIFKYFDGTTALVKADPLVLYRKMMEVGPSLSVDISVARSASKDADKAYGAMLDKMRSIFGVKDFDAGGLTESETVALFDKFNLFCEEVQKKTKNSQISATATPPTSEFSTADYLSMPSGSASGSTANESSSAVPQRPSSA